MKLFRRAGVLVRVPRAYVSDVQAIHTSSGCPAVNLGPRAPVALIVEDEWLLRDDIAQTLREAGWAVLEASTGEGAIALLHAGRRIDTVITDIHLAGYLSGWDVGEAFRARYPDIHIVYASGNSIERSRRVPGSLFFDKPYQTRKLLEALRAIA
jgi:CheY-like chemotaxis protein